MATLSAFRCANCGTDVSSSNLACEVCGERITNRVVVTEQRSDPPRESATATTDRLILPIPPSKSASEALGTTRPRGGWTTRRIALTAATVAVAIAIVSAGLYGMRVRATLRTVESMSTPPAHISASLLGGPSDVTIDTAAARAALTAAATDDGIEETPSANSGAPPAAEADQSTAAPSMEAEPEPTPAMILSQIERIKNGSFEGGAENWYTEADVSVVQTDAAKGANALQLGASSYAGQEMYLIPGATYHLSISGRISGGPGKAVVGIVYRAADTSQLSELEPKPLRFSGAVWIKQELTFQPPEGVDTIQLFLWKLEGGSYFQADDISVRTIVPPDLDPVTVPETDGESMTILVMGVDARDGEAIDSGVRPDSLMVLRLNGASGSCRLLSIPRDTRTELPGYGLTKVNHALAVGGIEYEQLVVEKLLGIPIDHYVLIDFNGFQDLVDAVGGITVDVAEPFVAEDGTAFNPGPQKMDGKRALVYARWRNGPDGDFGRIRRQQEVLRGLVLRSHRLNVVRSINELLPAVESNLRTDLSPREMASIASQYRSECTGETISMMNLEGSVATYDDPIFNVALSYVEVDAAEIRHKVAALLE